MRSFADEKKQGTLNYFNKTPKSLANRKRKISWCVATDCTGHYSNIHLCGNIQPSMPEGNIDMGAIGSYAGLMLLISAYSSIEFSSTLSDNQIVAFILSVFLFSFSFWI
jgi:ABC-2 type transport system permease protein